MAVAKKTSNTPSAKKEQQLDYMKGLNALPVSLSFMGGMALGRWGIAKLTKSKAVSGLMGTGTKKMFLPLGVTGLGLMAPQLFQIKNKLAIAVCHGVAGAGADATFKTVTGKTLVKTVSGLMGLGGDENHDENHDEIPEHTMRQIAATKTSIQEELPGADLDVEDLIAKELESKTVKGLNDNGIYSDDLGDANADADLDADLDTEIEGLADDSDINPFVGDIPEVQ